MKPGVAGLGFPRCCDRVAGCEVHSWTFQTPISGVWGCSTAFLIFPVAPPTGDHLGVGLRDSPNSSTSILFGYTGAPTTVLGVPAYFRVNQRASVKARSLGAASPVRPSPGAMPGSGLVQGLPGTMGCLLLPGTLSSCQLGFRYRFSSFAY